MDERGGVMITLVAWEWSGVLLIIGLGGAVEWSGKKGGVSGREGWGKRLSWEGLGGIHHCM